MMPADCKEVPILLENDREVLLVLPRPFTQSDLDDLKKTIDFLDKKLLVEGAEADDDDEQPE